MKLNTLHSTENKEKVVTCQVVTCQTQALPFSHFLGHRLRNRSSWPNLSADKIWGHLCPVASVTRCADTEHVLQREIKTHPERLAEGSRSDMSHRFSPWNVLYSATKIGL